jgi:glycerol-3-phosphate dehydrogenase
MAQSVDDVLARRMRASLLDRKAALESAPLVATLLAGELGLDDATQAAQVADFERAIQADMTAEGAAVAP